MSMLNLFDLECVQIVYYERYIERYRIVNKSFKCINVCDLTDDLSTLDQELKMRRRLAQ